MPVMVRGNQPQAVGQVGVKHNYSYPDGLDLRPGSELHDSLVKFALERIQVSYDTMSKRYDSWNEIDRTLTVYKMVSEEEKEVKEGDSRKPTSIVFPYSFAVMETILTYLVTTFLRDPVFPLKGIGPEDFLGAILLEQVIQHQVYRGKAELALHTFFRDCLAYGTGSITPVWEKWRGIKRKTISNEFGQSRVAEQGIVFEGNVTYNIDQYKFFPDPNVAPHKLQRGEFVGWLDTDNYMSLLQKEAEPDSPFFNVKYLSTLKGQRSQFSSDNSARTETSGVGDGDVSGQVTNQVDVIYIYITLIPKEHKLGTSEIPEKWLFGIGSDAILVRLEKAEQEHGQYPIVVGAPDFDGYSSSPISRLEILYGLQHVLDFLFNSHISNVRKAVNDMLVVDPYMINIKDLEDPKEGKIIRLRKPAWGRGVKDAVMQLGISDITRANIADADWIVQFINRIGAVDDSLMGVMRQGGPERLTGKEFSDTRGSAASRLDRIARVLSIQSMHDLGFMYASHTQQFMTEESWVELTGERARRLSRLMGGVPMDGQSMKIGPEHLSVNFDLIVKDGASPGAGIEGMMRIFETLARVPEVTQQIAGQLDMFRLFALIAQGWGVQNIDDLRKLPAQGTPTAVLPDEVVMNQLKAGNLMPVQMNGGMPQIGGVQ